MKYFKPKSLIKASGLAVFSITFGAFNCFAQTDTIYTNNQKIACIVKEVEPELIKFTLPGEDVVNAAYKNSVEKIVFKSGRVETFASRSKYKAIGSVKDYDNVIVTSLESEIKGLTKLDEVSSKAKGTTIYASQEHVKDRAYKKLKIQAALMGANAILLTNQASEGNHYGYFSSNSTSTHLSGTAYTSTMPDYNRFLSMINGKKQFTEEIVYSLGLNSSDYDTEEAGKEFDIDSIASQSGVVLIKGKLRGEGEVDTFQLAGFDDKTFSIYYRKKNTYYNIVFTFSK